MANSIEGLEIDATRNFTRAMGETYLEWKSSLGPESSSMKQICKRGNELCKLILVGIYEHEKLITPALNKTDIPDLQSRHALPANPELDQGKAMSLDCAHMHLSSAAQEIAKGAKELSAKLEAQLEAAVNYQPKEAPRVSATQAFDKQAIEAQALWRMQRAKEVEREMAALKSKESSELVDLVRSERKVRESHYNRLGL
jgi:hypothetical protein